MKHAACTMYIPVLVHGFSGGNSVDVGYIAGVSVSSVCLQYVLSVSSVCLECVVCKFYLFDFLKVFKKTFQVKRFQVELEEEKTFFLFTF